MLIEDMHIQYITFVYLCQCYVFLRHCVYLGEKVKAAEATDDAIDLREPPTFTTGL